MNDTIINICIALLLISAFGSVIATIMLFVNNISIMGETVHHKYVDHIYTSYDNKIECVRTLSKTEEDNLKNEYLKYCTKNNIKTPFDKAIILMSDDSIYSVLDMENKNG